MDLLTSLVSGGLMASTPPPDDDHWYTNYNFVMTASGLRIDSEGAKKVSAWYRGRDILGTAVAMMPAHVYRMLGDNGGREVARQHPLEDIVHRQPNAGDDAYQYRKQAMFDVIDHGWHLAFIESGARGFVHELHRVDPTLVDPPEKIKDGPLKGQWRFVIKDEKTRQKKTYRQDQIFFLRGADGKGILEYARDSIGLGGVLDNYAARIFSKGTLNGGYVETAGPMPDDEAMRRFAKQFATAFGDWHMPKVIPFGAKFATGPTLDPEKAQMILSRKFSVIDMARWLGLPAHMLNEVDTAGVTGLEQKGQEFVTFNMGGWLSMWEFAYNTQLILPLAQKTYFVEFTREALVRGDLQARAEADVAYVNAGIETPDEVRIRNNKPAMGGKASELREPQNITGKGAKGGPQDNRRPGKAGDGDDERARSIVSESARRIQRKEENAARRAVAKLGAFSEKFEAWAIEFYAEHQALIEQALCLSRGEAQLYCDSQRDDLIAQGLSAIDGWTPDYLVGLALDAPRPDPRDLMLQSAIERPAPAIQVNAGIEKGAVVVDVAPPAVHVESPVNLAPGALQVTAPVTIAQGAVQHTTKIETPAPKPVLVKKTVKRDTKGQITSVEEEHR